MLRPKKKITRKEIQRDQFLESVDQAQAHLEDNRSLYLKIGIGLIAVLLFFNFRSDQNAKHGTEASATLGKALVTLDQGDKSSAKFQLETVFNEFRGTSSALTACYYLGKMEYESDNISGAETYLSTFIKKNSKDPLAPSAAIMLSDIFMGSDNVDESLKMINKALRNSNNGDKSGHVRIFENIGGSWQQIGEDIEGEYGGAFKVSKDLLMFKSLPRRHELFS